MSDLQDIAADTAQFPWTQNEGTSLPCTNAYGRRSLIVRSDIDEVVANVCDDPLPEVGRWRDAAGAFWKRFELPCSDWQAGGTTSATTELVLMSKQVLPRRLNVMLAPALPRPMATLGTDEPNGTQKSLVPQIDRHSHDVALIAERITDCHVEFVHDLYDHQWTHRHFGEENVDGVAIRSVNRVLARWRRSGSHDEARLALIVKLASELPAVLLDVSLRPRVVLRRVREMLSVGRVQEIDATCLRWLARQPGRDIVEKAGTRQQVLGIARVEDADTPENRVVRDLVVRAALECRRYLSENGQFPNHPRVLLVRTFRSLLHNVLTDSHIGRVSSLVGEAQVNYVLQHEPRYSQLWIAYQQLVHQQKQQENIWRWRERTWAEVCRLTLWNAMRLLGMKGSAIRSDVYSRDEQRAGKFFEAKAVPASWAPTGSRLGNSIDIVDGSLIAQHPLIPRQLRSLCPDFVIVPHENWHFSGLSPMIPVWTLLQAPCEKEYFQQALGTLNRALQEIASRNSTRGLVVTPAHQGNAVSHNKLSHVEILQLDLPWPKETAVVHAIRRYWCAQ